MSYVEISVVNSEPLLDTTNLVAWWGAILSTVVFFWDIYKWWVSGPKVNFTVSTDMQILNVPGWKAGCYVTVRAINIGDQPTTITKLGILHYNSWFARLRDKATTKAVVGRAGVTQPLPHVLNPGEIWDGAVEQDDSLISMLQNGYLIVALYHSRGKRPVTRRAKPHKGRRLG